MSDLLKPKEVKVLQMIADGKIVRQISLEMKLSPYYVKGLKRNIYFMLGAVSAPHAVAIAMRAGIIK